MSDSRRPRTIRLSEAEQRELEEGAERDGSNEYTVWLRTLGLKRARETKLADE